MFFCRQAPRKNRRLKTDTLQRHGFDTESRWTRWFGVLKFKFFSILESATHGGRASAKNRRVLFPFLIARFDEYKVHSRRLPDQRVHSNACIFANVSPVLLIMGSVSL